MNPLELKEKAPQWPAVAAAGGWRSLSYLGYVDLADAVSRDMSKLNEETDPLSGDEKEEKAHRRG